MNDSSCRKFRFFIPLIIAAFLALATFVVQSLWNGVLADVLGVKTVTYWQALGILILAKLLFGGFPGRRGGPCGGPWRHRMMEARWNSLSPEDREKMRDEMRRRFGDWPRPPWADCGSEKPDAPTKA
jgi:Ca2+/H+ antiporter, TMEM165/GDT1 family